MQKGCKRKYFFNTFCKNLVFYVGCEYFYSNRTRFRSGENVADTKLTKRMEFVSSLSADAFTRFFMEYKIFTQQYRKISKRIL